jgi:hypothetical protein
MSEDELAWREAHGVLFRYYTAHATPQPKTVGEMAPLFASIYHGCSAEMHQEAWHTVYWPKICHGTDYFATRELGAFEADLVVLANFFEDPWERPASELYGQARKLVLILAASHLKGAGRLSEALAPARASLASRRKQGDWKEAALASCHVAELCLLLGRLRDAIVAGNDAGGYYTKCTGQHRDTRRRLVGRLL